MANKIRGLGKQRALTLIEMLISLVILSTLLTLGGQVFVRYSDSSGQSQGQLQRTVSELKNNQLLLQQLSSAFYYYWSPEIGRNELFFNGEVSTLRWIASRSWSQTQVPALALLHVDDGKLEYCEMPFDNYLLTEKLPDDTQICERFRRDIVTDVTKAAFRYYGEAGINEKFPMTNEFASELIVQPPGWSDAFSGRERRILPDYVVIQYEQDDQTYELWSAILNHDMTRVNEFNESFSG